MHAKLYHIKRDISDKIQEGLDSAHEIKSYNREDAFSNTLNLKLDNLEKFMIKGELLIGAFINLSYVFLKLGLPSVILYGAYLLATGSVSIFTYLVFLVVAARIYNPIMDAMNNFALLLYLNVRIKRMKEMPRQDGKSEFYPKYYDIEFNNVDFSYQDGVQTLKNVSFTAKQGEVTALVRPFGGEKSTIAKLSARFWDIDKGVITLIGENGERLSGGERQRISIARAILKDAPIILLDEATASLDAENESKIQIALSELIKNKTVLIIAHRMRIVSIVN